MRCSSAGALVLSLVAVAGIADAQLSVTIRDISPDRSTASDADAASGGRVNHIGIDPSNANRVFVASEYGGLWRSTDGGVTWTHLPGHVPTAARDVKVHPGNPNRVFAASLYDGRVNAGSGLNISTDGGTTWTRPASFMPPAGSCREPYRRTELGAFAIAIDPANSSRVVVGTTCGVALSTNSGTTWTFVDPSPGDGANDVYSIAVHHGIIDACGEDGHVRSTDGGTTWTVPGTLGGGFCSIAASPDEAHVLFVAQSNTVFESDDGGTTWPFMYSAPTSGGRTPTFVATNQRAGAAYDLWFGNITLFRAGCTTPNPPNPGGAQRCAGSGSWAGNMTRAVGGHDDTSDIAFVPGVANDACPRYFSSDGGIYRNTRTTHPGCQSPAWAQPNVTPHALWNYTMSGVPRPGATTEHIYFGNQDNGTFGATNAGNAGAISWNTEWCCDGFDSGGDASRALTTVCCFDGPRDTLMFRSTTSLTGAAEIPTYPPGILRGWEQLEGIVRFGANAYAVVTSSGVYTTNNIGAGSITWTQLGAATSPFDACGVQLSNDGGTPVFFVKRGGCEGDRGGDIFRYTGSGAGGTWVRVNPPSPGGFGVFAVDPNDPRRIIASHLPASGPRMVMTTNGGGTWTGLAALDALMTGHGTFAYSNRMGQREFTDFSGYPQPSLVAFDPHDPDILVAGGMDSGVFISTNGGTRWQLVTDPIAPATSGTPHIPRPFYAHFDHDPPGGDINLFVGTRGRGVWRLTFKKVAMPEIQVAAPPLFTASCRNVLQTTTMNVCNTSAGDLAVDSITSSNPEFVVTPSSGGYPVAISHDFCFPFQVSFTPAFTGPRTSTITIDSNDPSFPHLTVTAGGNAGGGTIVTVVADSGDYGNVCPTPGAHKDLGITVNNSGTCPLRIAAITSSSPEFVVPSVLTFPIAVAPGGNIVIPIRLQPSTSGAKNATITFASDDPSSPLKAVALTASVEDINVCAPPLFAALDAAVGPTFGSGTTGGFTVDATGQILAAFGPGRRFGVQGRGEAMYYPRRQEGELDLAMLYRRPAWQASLGGSFKTAKLRSELNPGSVSEATANIDWLTPTLRTGLFISKGIRTNDVLSSTTLLGVTTERVMHVVDTAGIDLQTDLAGPWWLDANVAVLRRHAPGASDTVGGALRFSRQFGTWWSGFVAVDVNESYISANTVGTVTVGVRLGRWPKPTDYTNRVNPLGAVIPRVHWEVFDRIR
ncbi:MAG TPA: choice-of-anchor D domain-containing protein [Thermoanaerobaculia bacterium]|nr:choice-of-anchor D domain-containing protein [Thermoanaerobaculia bacterium]